MTEQIKKNAIEKRLDIIEGFWNEFAENNDARILRWLVDSDEVRMIEVFLAVQNEEGSQVPDLFIRLDEPFVDPAQYGFRLVEALQHQYEEIREGLKEEKISADWICPAARPEESDVMALVRTAESLHMYYQSIMVRLVLAVLPKQIANETGWQAWVWKLAKAGVPTHVRVMVIDAVEKPSLEALVKEEPVLVQSIKPDLDMPSALMEIARDVPGNHPGNTFRRLLIALMNAAEKGDIKTGEQAASSAIAIAVKEGWPQMQIVVHMAMGATHLGAKQVDQALGRYRQAQAVAVAAEAQGDPVAKKLRLQGKLAEGAALISDSRYAEAAPVYEESAGLAESLEDHLMTLESWRMASHCHEVLQRWEGAWRCGELALTAATKMEPDQRKTSTLPYVGQGLLRVAQRQPGNKKEEQVNERMEALLGPEWTQALQPAQVPT